jgi:hypothetical protein
MCRTPRALEATRSTLISWAEVENQKMSFSNYTLEITYFDRRKPEPMVQCRHLITVVTYEKDETSRTRANGKVTIGSSIEVL